MALLTVPELATASDPRARIAEAALAVRKRHLRPDERADIESIEARREQLNEDRRPVEIRFYEGPDATAATGETPWRARSEPLGEVCRRASASRRKAMRLYGLVRELAPQRILEMGTCAGISGAYQGMALRHNGAGGRMLALDGAPDLAAVASKTYASLGLEWIELRVGPFNETLPGVLTEGPLDYAFVDGQHQEQATLFYLELLLPFVPQGLLVFDDIHWSEGMLRAWDRIASDERIALAIDLEGLGLAFTGEPAG
jgi:predicted O-methyltransferase YrrM